MSLPVLIEQLRRMVEGSWVNTINSTYWSLHWDKGSKWRLEEMPDG